MRRLDYHEGSDEDMPEMPSQIGRYLVVKALGAGAMGAVYLAEDPMLKRRVAVKVVRAIGEERELALERFRREAEISAQLNHPNIVTVYDVGEQEGVGPFIAMEYVEGSSLGRLVREGALAPEASLSILIQAMRALRTAHRHAIVHRDIKPDNILVAEDGRVKLMDFGIARTMAPRLTGLGEFLGSPAYSAPELLRGEEPTPSSDRYSFAVTAFELLTGHLPHPGSNVAAVITHILHDPPVIPLSMPSRVAYVFQRALARDPEDRYDSLPEFVMDLVESYPLDGTVKARVQELFRHDDHAGDIIPARWMKARASQPQGPPSIGEPGTATAGGIRATPQRPLLVPTSSVKIELEAPGAASERSTASRMRIPVQPPPREGVSPWTIVKWILIVLVGGQLFWLLYGFLKASGS